MADVTFDNLTVDFTGTVVLPATTSIGPTTATELGYVHGVSSAIQTQLDAKANTRVLVTVPDDSTRLTGNSGATGNPANYTFLFGDIIFVNNTGQYYLIVDGNHTTTEDGYSLLVKSGPTLIQFRQGTNSEVNSITPEAGEPVWDTTFNRLTVGNGSVAGGISVSRLIDQQNTSGLTSYKLPDYVGASGIPGLPISGVAGNPMGLGSIDLTTYRTAAAQVPSADGAVQIGLLNQVTGSFSLAIGVHNVITAGSSIALGTQCFVDSAGCIGLGNVGVNISTGSQEAIALGGAVGANSPHSITFGGAIGTGASSSLAIGQGASSYMFGHVSIMPVLAGSFTPNNSAYFFKAITLDATPLELTVDGQPPINATSDPINSPLNRFRIPLNRKGLYKVSILADDEGGGTYAATYDLLIGYDGDFPTIIDQTLVREILTPIVTAARAIDPTYWTVAFGEDHTNNVIALTAKGTDTDEVVWFAKVEGIEFV